MADRADPTAQAVAWQQLEQLRNDLGATRLIGTVGNHDVDSRAAFDEFDTKGALQSLMPAFPGLSENDCDFFWSRNFAVLETSKVLLLILNSSAFHGINSDSAAKFREFEHGRVSDRTIAAIQQKLGGRERPLQILLTHHHFYKNEKIFAKDYSEMTNGTKLLEVLSTKGNWVVLHGHQHYPMISYAMGDTSSPVIFSAGSFSRKLNELSRESANQFYHIRFPISDYEQLGWRGCGICHAWDWSPGYGWSEARGNAKIPSRAGFGCREATDRIVGEIEKLISSMGGALDWADLPKTMPTIQYMLPSEIERVKGLLEQRGLAVYGSPFSERCQISKK